MKKIIFSGIGGILLVLLFQFFTKKSNDTSEMLENSALIQEQIKNVGKLIVTEGHFSEIMTYKDAKKYLGDWISFDKKALIIVNADVLISYDLQQLKYDIDAPNKTIKLANIPSEEIKIYPKITYYDIVESQFNTFTSEDHNKIRQKAENLIQEKISQSAIKENAKHRLISELSKILILTHSMGWILQYNETYIHNETDFIK